MTQFGFLASQVAIGTSLAAVNSAVNQLSQWRLVAGANWNAVTPCGWVGLSRQLYAAAFAWVWDRPLADRARPHVGGRRFRFGLDLSREEALTAARASPSDNLIFAPVGISPPDR